MDSENMFNRSFSHLNLVSKEAKKVSENDDLTDFDLADEIYNIPLNPHNDIRLLQNVDDGNKLFGNVSVIFKGVLSIDKKSPYMYFCYTNINHNQIKYAVVVKDIWFQTYLVQTPVDTKIRLVYSKCIKDPDTRYDRTVLVVSLISIPTKVLNTSSPYTNWERFINSKYPYQGYCPKPTRYWYETI